MRSVLFLSPCRLVRLQTYGQLRGGKQSLSEWHCNERQDLHGVRGGNVFPPVGCYVHGLEQLLGGEVCRNGGNERNRPGMRRVQRWKILRDVERKRMQGMGKLFCRHLRLSGRVAESEPRMHRVRLWKVYKCIKLGRVPEMDRVQWAGRRAWRGDRIVGSYLRRGQEEISIR